MKPAIFIVAIMIATFLISCNNKSEKKITEVDTSAITPVTMPEQKKPVDSTIIQIYIDSTGIITANDKIISLKGLDSSLRKLKRIDGTIHYSRDNSTGEPAKESMKVIELVTKHSLRLKFYTDKTFTEIVKIN